MRDRRLPAARYLVESSPVKKIKQLALAGAGFAAGVAMTFVTLGQVAPTASAAPTEQHNDAMMAAQKAQVIATTFQLDKSDFHDVDESLAAGTMPSGALGNVRRARIALMATDWPEAMHEKVRELGGQMIALEEALRAEDVARAAPHAKKVHDLGHDLSAAVYTMLSTGQAAPAHGH